MEKEPRKASDVLLDLENKIDTLLSIVRSQDLNIKVLSNKLNNVMESLSKQPAAPQKITVEAVNTLPMSHFQQIPNLDPTKQIPVSSEAKLPLETSPKGFRRSSRPETFAGDDSYLARPEPEAATKFPVQMPKPPPGRSAMTEAVITAPNNKAEAPSENLPKRSGPQNSVPVIQRIVDKEGKSVFLGNVEIIDLANMQTLTKTRTNGTGKWMASLPVGNYRIIIRKGESKNKEKIEVGQNIQVDGSTSPLELQTMIIT